MSVIFQTAALLWRDMSEDYRDAIEADFIRASRVIGGAMLTTEARRMGITEHSLFRGPAARAYRFASPELIEWWENHPRRDRATFENEWLATRGGFA